MQKSRPGCYSLGGIPLELEIAEPNFPRPINIQYSILSVFLQIGATRDLQRVFAPEGFFGGGSSR
jgi:hypothetical protein